MAALEGLSEVFVSGVDVGGEVGVVGDDGRSGRDEKVEKDANGSAEGSQEVELKEGREKS